MEILNLLLTSDQQSVQNFLSSYSSNEIAKERLLEALLMSDNPYDINVDYEDVGENETKKLVRTLMFNLGLTIDDVNLLEDIKNNNE